MERAGAVHRDRCEMHFRGIARMSLEPIGGIGVRYPRHEAVPDYFRDDRRSRDRGAERVPVDDRLGGAGEAFGDVAAVDQGEGWNDGERAKRAAHGEERRLSNVETIDLRGAREGDGNGSRTLDDLVVEAFANGRRELLRVVEAFGNSAWVEDDRGRSHRPGERPASRLVDPCDGPVAAGSQALFMGKVGS